MTAVPSVPVPDLDGNCLRCHRCAGCHAETGGCPEPNTTCVIGSPTCGRPAVPDLDTIRAASAHYADCARHRTFFALCDCTADADITALCARLVAVEAERDTLREALVRTAKFAPTSVQHSIVAPALSPRSVVPGEREQ